MSTAAHAMEALIRARNTLKSATEVVRTAITAEIQQVIPGSLVDIDVPADGRPIVATIRAYDPVDSWLLLSVSREVTATAGCTVIGGVPLADFAVWFLVEVEGPRARRERERREEAAQRELGRKNARHAVDVLLRGGGCDEPRPLRRGSW